MPNNSVLIVDDDVDIRDALSAALQVNGYPTITAPSGREALIVLKKLEKKPALILLDLMMPEMDGFEFMQTRDMSTELAKIPIVLISASGDFRPKLTDYSAKGYLKKPIGIADLLETAERYCD